MHVNLSSTSPICDGCETFLLNLSPVMRSFSAWIFKTYTDIHICQGFRSEADQHADFLSGKSRLDYPRSAHNNIANGEPSSEAIDVFILNPDGTASWPLERFKELHLDALEAKQPVYWGGLWPGFPDSDHWQNSAWIVPL